METLKPYSILEKDDAYMAVFHYNVDDKSSDAISSRGMAIIIHEDQLYGWDAVWTNIQHDTPYLNTMITLSQIKGCV